MFGIDSVPLLEEATRLELAGGLTTKLNDRLSLYAQAGYQFAVAQTNDTTRNGVKGDVGLRYAW
jgi:outer membrane autotransporter protein